MIRSYNSNKKEIADLFFLKTISNQFSDVVITLCNLFEAIQKYPEIKKAVGDKLKMRKAGFIKIDGVDFYDAIVSIDKMSDVFFNAAMELQKKEFREKMEKEGNGK